MKNLLKLVVFGVGLWGVSGLGAPATNILVVDRKNNRVLEIKPDGSIRREFTAGFSSPREAIPLLDTNGNLLVADRGNNRIVEINSKGENVGILSFSSPIDVRRCRWYDPTTGVSTETILIAGKNGVKEVDYPTGTVFWEYNISSPQEAEKRPGSGAPVYLIATNAGVYEVEYVSSNAGNIIGTYTPQSSNQIKDVEWLPEGIPEKRVLVVEGSNIYEVKLDNGNGSIVGTWTPNPFDCNPWEATMIEDGKILVAGTETNQGVVQGVVYEIRKMKEGTESYGSITWEYTNSNLNPEFVDVEEKGIINLAAIIYESNEKEFITRAGVSILEVSPPNIKTTKTVTPNKAYWEQHEEATFTITYTNEGDGTATNVIIIDQISEGLEFVETVTTDFSGSIEYSSSASGEEWSENVTNPVIRIRWIDNKDLPPKGTREVIFRVRVK